MLGWLLDPVNMQGLSEQGEQCIDMVVSGTTAVMSGLRCAAVLKVDINMLMSVADTMPWRA